MDGKNLQIEKFGPKYLVFERDANNMLQEIATFNNAEDAQIFKAIKMGALTLVKTKEFNSIVKVIEDSVKDLDNFVKEVDYWDVIL